MSKRGTPKTDLIVVLDVDTRDEALKIIESCGGCRWFKIGAQLFTRCGPSLVTEVKAMGKNIFLDLKYHDIPNTVASAARAAADLGAGLFTIHAAGGRKMISAARQVIEETPAKMLAVTVLTSLTDAMLREEVGIDEPVAETVPRLAGIAVSAGAHGIVCSPQEIGRIRNVLGAGPIVVTPGVRPAWASKDDQARVMTPREAVEAGADYLVVGRPILKHANPAEAVARILEEMQV